VLFAVKGNHAMTLIVPNLSITNFRSFRKLDIGPFGRVNLITGKNNAGKSSLLEAIRIMVTEGSPGTFLDILKYREELDWPFENEKAEIFKPEEILPFCSLISGFPDLENSEKAFAIQVHDECGTNLNSILFSIVWLNENRLSRAVIENPKMYRYPAIIIDLPKRDKSIIIEEPWQLRRIYREPGDAALKPCILLNPSDSKETGQLGALWDKIALTDVEDEVIRGMRIISPDIQKISMIGSDTATRSRKAIAKSSRYERPVLLRNFGDGANRLFGLVLSLACARGGVLLVDEIENGFHYSILPDVWRAIFRLASDLNVQVFATTHNWDCIDAFRIAASEHPEEGVLARLTVKDDQVIPTLFREDELRIITRDRIEVR
jgi:hypothetical protein